MEVSRKQEFNSIEDSLKVTNREHFHLVIALLREERDLYFCRFDVK